MKKHLHRMAAQLQEGLRQAAESLPGAQDWSQKEGRARLDAWATLYRWSRAGEPTVRLTETAEEAMLDRPLPADLPLESAPLATEALACQLPTRSDWIVVARHAPALAWVQVCEQQGWHYPQALLTYVSTIDGQVRSGFLTLSDYPTPADLRLRPGWLQLGEVSDEFALALGVDALYRRAKKNQKKV